MTPYISTACDDLELYALKGLDSEEQLQFEKHLAACRSCQSKLAELREVTDALLYAPADVEPPQGMRDRVLAAVTALPQEEPPFVAKMSIAPRKTWQQRLFPYVSVAAVLAVAFLSWQNAELQQQTAAQSEQIEQLGKLVASVTMTPAGQPFNGVNGQAMLLEEDGQKIVMIKASNLPKPTEREQYTLWVMNQGKTQVLNGGTFLPTGNQGVGMVMFPVTLQDFDTVAVSLEPDAYSGDAPRGVPVMTAQFKL